MWFIGDNEQRRAGSIERLPEGPGRTTTVCCVPAPHRCAEASLSSLRLASNHRAHPAEPDPVPGLDPKSRTHTSGPIRRVSFPRLVRSTKVSLPPRTEIRKCIPLIKVSSPGCFADLGNFLPHSFEIYLVRFGLKSTSSDIILVLCPQIFQ